MPTSRQDLSSLKALGSSAKPSRTLEAFPSHGSDMEVTLHCTEFTCVCPLTGQPDFAEIEITYVPDKFIVESKSMKLYLETYRNVGIFHEHLAVDIGKDFVKFIKPKMVEVIVESKSMKLYLETYRNVGIFHEHLAVDIGKDFVKFIKPKKVEVTVRFNVRGGIAIDATWRSGQ